MELTFSGRIFQWRGPAPFLFVRVPEKEAGDLRAIASLVTYGWGVIPVQVQVGATTWSTSLFPKDGGYLVPIKLIAQKAEDLKDGDEIELTLTVRLDT